MIKQFLQWIGLKEKLHQAEHVPPLFKEHEIWWCSIGENIGNEVNGNGTRFTRPVFILKKYDAYSFFGLPLTTKEKEGSWYVHMRFKEKNQTVVLMQGRVLDYRRLKEKMGEVEAGDSLRIREAFLALHAESINNRPLTVASEGRGLPQI